MFQSWPEKQVQHGFGSTTETAKEILDILI